MPVLTRRVQQQLDASLEETASVPCCGFEHPESEVLGRRALGLHHDRRGAVAVAVVEREPHERGGGEEREK